MSVATAATAGSTGEATIGFLPIIHPASAQDPAVLIVTQSIRDDAGRFTAPGLTLGGRTIWKYVWEFRGLKP